MGAGHYTNSNLLFLGCGLNSDRTVQVFRAIKQKIGDVDIPQHFAIEQAPGTEQALSDRNAYLLGLGITGMWFEKGQFECVQSMLRLARNELRYRGVFPDVMVPAIKPVIDERSRLSASSWMRRLWTRLSKKTTRVPIVI